MCTCVNFSTSCDSTLSLLVSMVVSHDTFPQKTGFPPQLSAACALQPAERVKQCLTFQITGPIRLSVPSPFFPSWQLSLTENQCRSVTPCSEGHCLSPFQIQAGATASLLTLPNEATEDWWKHSGTPECVPAKKLLITLSTFSFLFPWWFMIPSPKPFHFLTQLNCTEARRRTPVETLFNHTVLADPCAFPFHRLPSHRGN